MTAARVRVRTADNTFQHFEVLKHNRTKRHRFGECFVEGVKAIERALAGGWTFSAVAFAAGRTRSAWAERVLANGSVETVVEMDPALMARLSDREHTSELLALVRLRQRTLAELSGPGPVLVLDRLSSPGNLGSLIRTAHAFGAAGALLAGHAADPYDPLSIRASLGTVFALPVVALASAAEVAAWARSAARRLVGTDSAAELQLTGADLSGRVALVLGNEAGGLSHAFGEACEIVVRIPAQSLNVAAAGAILLYAATRGSGRSG